jgi:glycosyltransferase 2 family protein
MTWALDQVQIEDRAEPPRTRRTSDLLRLLLTVAVMALVVFAGSIGSGTTAGIQEDITTAVTNVPSLVVSLLATLNNLIVLALPIYVVADLVIRRRWRMLVTALFASSLALVAANLFSRYADQMLDGALLDALTLPTGGGSARTAAAFGVFAGVAALMSAEGQAARSRTRVVVWSALVALGALFLIDRRATPLALLLSVLGGHAIGLVARYVAGTENPRVPARRIVEALARVGVQPIHFRQLEESDLGRRFELETADGRVGVAQVFDPDRRTSQLIAQLTRIVRVRAWVTRSPGWSERAQVQQAAVPILMATANGIRTPELLAAVEVDDRTMAVVEERPQRLRLLNDFPAEAISDEALAQVWREVRRMHHLGIAHEGLHDGSFAVDDDGRVWVLGLDRGEIAAPRLRMRLDRAELLIATAMLVGGERAITAADRAIGSEDLANLPALMQPIALNPATRAALGAHPELLSTLRDEAIARAPEPSADDVRLERLRPRSVISLVAATFAVYVLAGQLGNVDFGTVISSIDWTWAAGALAASLLTYVGAALAMRPFSPVSIPIVRWIMTQFAATFVTLVAPAAVGSAGTNARLIQQAGAPSGLALASVGVSSLVALVTTLTALIGISLVSAESPAWNVEVPSTGVLIGGGVVLALMLLAFVIPFSRRIILTRLRPTWENIGPRLLDILRSPKRLAAGAAGNLVSFTAYATTLYAAVHAYGESIPFAAAVVVYLGAGLLGSVAPTPGGIGAVEAALIAGLSAVGVPPSAALPAALLYRTVTFWLPTIPGWAAFQWLQRRGAI